MEIGILPNAAMLLLVSRVILLVINMSYYLHLGRKPKKMWADHAVCEGEGLTEHRAPLNGWRSEGCGVVVCPGLRKSNQRHPACRKQAQFSDVEHDHV